jgi:hypothetical protein
VRSLVLVLTGCLGTVSEPIAEETPRPDPMLPTPELPPDAPPPPSDNPIDVAIWPRIVAERALPLAPASDEELCRRMSLDLRGVLPLPSEVDALCRGRTASEMARTFMDDERFVEREVLLFIRHVGAEPIEVWTENLLDGDRVYARVARGEIGYDDFAAELMAHPVMTINRPAADDDDPAATIEHAFRIFLGRRPHGAEASDFGNVLRVWHRGWESRPFGNYKRPAYLDYRECTDAVFGAAACTSVLLGDPVTIDLPSELFPSMPAVDYESSRDGMFYYETVHGGLMDAAMQRELEKPGRLLASRDEFWDEAADRALNRILGWWRSTANEPDSTLPEVRLALARSFRASATHDLRDLYHTILTSILYTTSSRVSDEIGERSLWSVGPVKTMDGEQYLDSLERVFEREMGFCETHVDAQYDDFFPNEYRRTQPEDFYGFGYDFYFENGKDIGGCTGPFPAPREPGLRALFAHVNVADELCPEPAVLYPDGFDANDASDENAVRLAEHVYPLFLTRAPADDERALVRETAAACRADPECSDGTIAGFASELCGALLRSAEFVFY